MVTLHVGEVWALCHLCGKAIAVEPVEPPVECAALLRHRKEHADRPADPPRNGVSASSHPASTASSSEEASRANGTSTAKHPSHPRAHGRMSRLFAR